MNKEKFAEMMVRTLRMKVMVEELNPSPYKEIMREMLNLCDSFLDIIKVYMDKEEADG